MRRLLKRTAVLLAGSMLAATAGTALAKDRTAPARSSQRPNVVIILADDMGHADLSATGNRMIQTRAIDSIGRDGVTFTNGYSTAPLCSPSRAGLVTGRYQQRFGFEQQVSSGAYPELREVRDDKGQLTPLQGMEEFDRRGVPVDEKNIAELFKAQGYTTGVFGKWHLGHAAPFAPNARGFDYSNVFYGNTSIQYKFMDDPDMVSLKIDFHDEAPLTAWTREGLNSIRENGKVIKVDNYLLFHFRDAAVNFIEQNKNKPFLLYFPMNAPVPPLQVPLGYFEKLRTRIPNIATRGYNALLMAQDDAVAAVLDELKKAGIEKNTIVVFVSDNGSSISRPGSNAPFSGGKYSTLEGGIHMPYMMKWPGHIAAGSTYAQNVSTLDILPTAAAAAHVPVTAAKPLDGVDLLPYLDGRKNGAPHEILFWKLSGDGAARMGKWKLYSTDHGKTEQLFDLDQDPGEKTDLSAQQPQIFADLKARYAAWDQTLPPRSWTNISPVFHK